MENKDDWKKPYEIVLEDLERRKDSIDNAILGIKTILGMGDGTVRPIAIQAKEELSVGLQDDSFFGLGLIEAAKKYLAISRKPKSSPEIAMALQAGGFHTTSKDFKNTVTSVLHRHATNVGEIIKVQKNWGLAEWYPGLKKGRTGTRTEVNDNNHSENDEKDGDGIKDEKQEY